MPRRRSRRGHAGFRRRRRAGASLGPRPGRRDLREPGALRRLLRPRRRAPGRRLLPRVVELQQRAGPARPPLARPRQLDDRRPRPRAPAVPRFRPPTARQGRLGPVDPAPRGPLLDLLGRSRRGALHDERRARRGAVGAGAPREAGARPDRRLSPVGRRREDVRRARVGEEPGRLQRGPHRARAQPRRPARDRRGADGLRRRDEAPDHRGAEALQAGRLVLDLRPRRRRADGLAGRAPLAIGQRPLRGPDRPRPGTDGRQRPAPGGVGGRRRTGRTGSSTSRTGGPTAGSCTCSRCAGRTAGR